MNHMTFGSTVGAVVRPQTLRHAAKIVTRQRLMASARTLFLDLGYEATTVREIAAGADRSIGAVFNCFNDKLDLLEAVMVEEAAELADAAREAIIDSPDFVDALHRLHALMSEPACARVVLIERNIPSTRRRVQAALMAVLMETVVAARGRGEIAPHLQLDLICGLVWDLLAARCQAALDNETETGATQALTCDRIDLMMSAITP